MFSIISSDFIKIIEHPMILKHSLIGLYIKENQLNFISSSNFNNNFEYPYIFFDVNELDGYKKIFRLSSTIILNIKNDGVKIFGKINFGSA